MRNIGLCNLGNLSRFRTQLMAVSIIFILLCHAKINGASFPHIVLVSLSYLDIGVDMFLLFSGIGIYYSLRKSLDNKTYTYGSFIIKRLKRVLISYFIIESLYWIWYCFINNLGIIDFIYYISFASFWVEHIGLWFLAFLLPLYFVSPFLLRLVGHNKVLLLILVLGSVMFSKVPFELNNELLLSILKNIQFVSERFPCYVIGLWVGAKVQDNYKIHWFILLTGAFMYLLFSNLPYISLFYWRWILAVVASIFIAEVINFASNLAFYNRMMERPITIIGKSTLYIYIFSDVLTNLCAETSMLEGTIRFLFISFGSLILGIIYYHIDGRIIYKIH